MADKHDESADLKESFANVVLRAVDLSIAVVDPRRHWPERLLGNFSVWPKMIVSIIAWRDRLGRFFLLHCRPLTRFLDSLTEKVGTNTRNIVLHCAMPPPSRSPITIERATGPKIVRKRSAHW